MIAYLYTGDPDTIDTDELYLENEGLLYDLDPALKGEMIWKVGDLGEVEHVKNQIAFYYKKDLGMESISDEEATLY